MSRGQRGVERESRKRTRRLSMLRVPVTEGLRSGDADIGQRKSAVSRGKICQRIDFLTPADTQNRSANEEKRNIRADFGSDAKLLRPAQRRDPVRGKFALESNEGRSRICGASTESALYRQTLVYIDANLSG